MKPSYFVRTLAVLVLAVWCALPAAAQRRADRPAKKLTLNVPAAVQAAYADRFGGTAPTPVWDRERGNVWQASFRLPSTGAASARFDADGRWLETTQAARAKELPPNARAYILERYPKQRVRGVAFVTRADATRRWKVHVAGQRLFFDPTGHLLATTPARGMVAKQRGPKARKTAPIVGEPPAPAPVAVPVAGPAQAER